MIIKVFCLFVLIVLFVLLGYIKTTELSVNYANLRALIDALTMLETEIKTKNSMLDEAFSACAKAERTGIFYELAEIANTDGDYTKINATLNKKICDNNARSALFSFVGGLKNEDIDGQTANIKSCRDRLIYIYKEMGSSLEKMKKIYFLSFVLSGAAIIVLFI